ncbi:CehA/McbA family metallohydrolase [Sphingomonas sp. RB56-2]|uniref:CehA/McbA family metallohydrolase n=1 Tax=Sphingomonas brevis TaxID=2908206 RepID=A0ABT0SA16_9SPHN|nr:CehA/McbA family metallohydrolase [Sphingomonas brevis]MCL6740992.1 CehA/McbA family metallohydrolase [Sphingomonas brevis]
MTSVARVAMLTSLLLLAAPAGAGREAVLKQVDLPHSYYWRELYIPQLTTGPSGLSFTPDGSELIYSMGGSLWLQKIGSDEAIELTHPRAAYDYQPDVAPDGGSVLFSRYDGNGIELWRLDLATGREQVLTVGNAVNVEPRLSPDGKQVAWVSTAGTGHFNLFVADIGADGLHNPQPLLGERKSAIARYYYSAFDHALNPSWTPDGKRILYVSNNEAAWGTGDIWSMAVGNPADRRKVLSEETSWDARPEMSPDGKQLLFASYHGRQWRQLWLTTPDGAAPLPLTFGEFDRASARWSPDGRRIGYISNERGNTSLFVQDYVGGATTPIVAGKRRYKVSTSRLTLDIRDERGSSVPARVAVIGSDGRAAAPASTWMHADDGFDRARQAAETHYFHCPSRCTIDVPAGDTAIWVQRGFRYDPWRQKVKLTEGTDRTVPVTLSSNDLPASFGNWRSADLHVHMNYGGHYRNTPENLARQARAEDLDVIYNLIVNKEERVPDIGYFRPDPDPASGAGVLIMHAQEFHTSYWGHLGLLHLSDHVLTPDFSAYRHTALASPFPHNGTIADLAHDQGALVGYVHPFDWDIDPATEKSLTNMLPADAANGKVDYIEIVGFSDHKATANVWYRLLNLGFRLPAGAGTDAMANYASLRGPVGMNRVFLETGGETTPAALRAALKAGRTFASNGPLLGLELGGKRPGDTISRPAPGKIGYRIALRSPVSVDHLELVHNGKVVKAFALKGDRRSLDATGELAVDAGGWLLLRAWNDGADPLVLDIYPYATTSPIYLELPSGPPAAPRDAAYFAAWMDRVLADAASRNDYRSESERESTLAYLRKARDHYLSLANEGPAGR